MSTLSSYRRTTSDHFEPEQNLDPQAQRKLRGQLEQIDYIAFASNRWNLTASADPSVWAIISRLEAKAI
jgi:hypothetical protein